jgi:hypothetical protein
MELEAVLVLFSVLQKRWLRLRIWGSNSILTEELDIMGAGDGKNEKQSKDDRSRQNTQET